MSPPHADGDDVRHRFGSVTSEQVAALDRAATQHGHPVATLMEIAGLQVARWAWSNCGEIPVPLHVVAGHGNNGGDGMVAARYLQAWGCSVSLDVIAEPGAASELVETRLELARQAGVHINHRPGGDITAPADAIIIDALLGSGLRGRPHEAQARAIAAMRGHGVISVDLPSGLDATTGIAADPTVNAESTVTFAAVKRGLWTAEGRACAGTIVVADIGIPLAAWRACELNPPTDVRGGKFWPLPSDTP